MSKTTTYSCVLCLIFGVMIGVGATGLGTAPTPAPVPAPGPLVPIPDPVPDTPTPDAPIKVAVGEIVRLTEAEGGDVAWAVEPPIPDLVTFGDRNESSVTSYRAKGVYTVIAAIVDRTTGVYINSGPGLSIKRYTVIVGDFVPAPGPGPIPNPEPNPRPLPGPTPQPTPAPADFADTVKLIPDAAEAQKLAKSFRDIAGVIDERIKARKLMPPDEIIEITKVANNEALGSSIDKWQPFFSAMEGVLNKLATDGKLNTMTDHVDRWNEIAATLESVK